MEIHSVPAIESVTCEHCDSAVDDHINAHSMWAVLQKVSADGYSWFQCAEGQTFRDVNYQHFHCDHDHMITGMLRCIESHYQEATLQKATGTNLHSVVLQAGLLCKACHNPLTKEAYRFCLTQGLPFHRVPDNSTEAKEQWCCSLEHAKICVRQVLQAMEEHIP
jgi:hypothetical protein